MVCSATLLVINPFAQRGAEEPNKNINKMKKKRFIMLFASAAVLMVGCEKENENNGYGGGSNVNIPSSITVNVGQTYSLGSTQSWSSSSEFVATVTGNGTVTGKHVGNCRVSCSAGSCNVTVRATINLFSDPYTQWGASKSQVIAYQGSDYTETSSGNGLSYSTGNSIAPNIGYVFQNGGLSAVLIPVMVEYKSQVIDHLSQRYRYLGETGGEHYFADGNSASDATTAVQFKRYNSNYWQVLYMPYSN